MIENLKPYPDYKESGLPWLGEVPVHWGIARGRQLFEVRKRVAGTLGYPVLSITQQGLRVKDVSRGEGQLSQDYSKYQLVKAGEFAMNAMDLITGGIGIAAHEGVTSPDYRVFAIRNEEQHNSRFYLLLLRMLYANLAFYSCGQGSAQHGRWRLPRKRFNDFFYPTPPASEQASITRFLTWATNRLDRAIGAKRRIIALLQEQKQAIIHRAVTRGLDPSVPLKDSGIPWLGEIPEHWEVRKIRAVASRMPKGTTPTTLGKQFVSRGIRFVKAESISADQGIIGEKSAFINIATDNLLNRSRLRASDVAISIAGAIRRPASVAAALLPVNKNQAVGIVSLLAHLYRPERLAYTIASPMCLRAMADASVQSAQANLSGPSLGRTVIPLPPLHGQASILEYLATKTDPALQLHSPPRKRNHPPRRIQHPPDC